VNSPNQTPDSNLASEGLIASIGCGQEILSTAAMCPHCGIFLRSKRYKSKVAAAHHISGGGHKIDVSPSRIKVTVGNSLLSRSGETILLIPREGEHGIGWDCKGGTVVQKYLPMSCR